MPAAELPANEAERLQRLQRLRVLDSAPEQNFDALVRAAALVCGTPISLISLIDQDRQWFKANVGLPGVSETHRSSAFCAHAIGGTALFEVPDATLDARFVDNPLVTGAPDIRFYAGAPLVMSDGSNLGTLCVIDRQPRLLDDRQREILACLAQAAVSALEGRQAALELHEAEERQHQLLKSLELEHRRRGELLITLAHELRNPLSALRTGSQLLRMAKHNGPAVEKVNAMVERQVTHMARLVDDLAEASRIASGKIEIQTAETTLGTIVSSALEASLFEIERGKHELQVEVPAEETAICVDAVRVSQAITNLLVNAAKYTREGGHVSLHAAVESGDLVIVVADNGIGIDADCQARVFDMFVQVSGERTAERGGLGVGLALVKSVAQLHGGSVTVASQGLGHGSAFTLRLPGVIART